MGMGGTYHNWAVFPLLPAPAVITQVFCFTIMDENIHFIYRCSISQLKTQFSHDFTSGNQSCLYENFSIKLWNTIQLYGHQH